MDAGSGMRSLVRVRAELSLPTRLDAQLMRREYVIRSLPCSIQHRSVRRQPRTRVVTDRPTVGRSGHDNVVEKWDALVHLIATSHFMQLNDGVASRWSSVNRIYIYIYISFYYLALSAKVAERAICFTDCNFYLFF